MAEQRSLRVAGRHFEDIFKGLEDSFKGNTDGCIKIDEMAQRNINLRMLAIAYSL